MNITTNNLKRNYVTLLFATLIIGLSIFWIIMQMSTPEPLKSSTSLKNFSAERAMEYIKPVTQNPHPTGTLENEKVLNYIVKTVKKIGYKCDIQQGTSFLRSDFLNYRASNVKNIIVRIKGKNNTKSVMLTAHYDTTPGGPGVSDDMSGVATLIETMRALKENKPLNNDVIFLFTDGEELDLNGAMLFAQKCPLFKNVGLILNMEARGNKGQSFMFETSGNNGKLMSEFSKVVPYPSATSLSYDVYSMLDNDTDFSVYKNAGKLGFNFSAISGADSYHSMLDNYKNMDRGTLQQNGYYALSLLKHFGNIKLSDNLKKSDCIYFNLSKRILVTYPTIFNPILSVVAIFLFIAVMITGMKKKKLSIKGVTISFISFIITVGIMGIFAKVLEFLIGLHLGKYYSMILLDNSLNKFWLGTILLLTCGLYMVICTIKFKKLKFRVLELVLGPQILLLIACIAMLFEFTGAHYLVVWPLIFMLLTILIVLLLFKDKLDGHYNLAHLVIIFLIPEIVTLMFLLPIINLLYLAIGYEQIIAYIILFALVLACMIPYILLITDTFKYAVFIVPVFIAITLVTLGQHNLKFSPQHPLQSKPVSYVLNSETNKAYWVKMDRSTNEWSKQFFVNKSNKDNLIEVLPFIKKGLLVSDAPVNNFKAPELKLTKDVTKNGTRVIMFHVKSLRKATNMYIRIPWKVNIKNIDINGVGLSKFTSSKFETKNLTQKPEPKKIITDNGITYILNDHWNIAYCGLPEDGADVTIKVKYNKPFKIQLIDETNGLSAIKGFKIKDKPNYIITSSGESDTIRVSKYYNF